MGGTICGSTRVEIRSSPGEEDREKSLRPGVETKWNALALEIFEDFSC